MEVIQVGDVVTPISLDDQEALFDMGAVTGILRVVDVQGNILLGRYFNESGTYNYVNADVDKVFLVA